MFISEIKRRRNKSMLFLYHNIPDVMHVYGTVRVVHVGDQ